MYTAQELLLGIDAIQHSSTIRYIALKKT